MQSGENFRQSNALICIYIFLVTSQRVTDDQNIKGFSKQPIKILEMSLPNALTSWSTEC